MIQGFFLAATLLPIALTAAAQQPGPATQPASAPAAAVSPYPSVTAALQRCDKSIGEATTMAVKIEECAKQLKAEHAALASVVNTKPSSVSRGLPDTRFLSIPEDVSSPAAKDLLLHAAPSAMRKVLAEYYSYLAFAAGDPAPCKRLAAIDCEDTCRENFASLNVMRAVMGEPWELVKSCRAAENKNTPTGCCAALAKLKDRSNPCAQLAAVCFKEMASCKAFWGRAEGDSKACALLPVVEDPSCKLNGCKEERDHNVANCEGEAAYARAFKAKDVAACGGSQRCRVLMGQGKEVAAEIAAAKLQNPGGDWFLKGGWKTPPPPAPPPAPESVPAPAAARKPHLDYLGFACVEPLQSADNRKVIGNIIAVAKTCLTDIETAVGSPSIALTEGLDERDEKLARLNVRMELALADAAPVKPQPAAARAPR